MQDEITLVSLRDEVRRLRAELARYRRYLDDLLVNLEEENMPTVAEKLSTLSAGISPLLGDNGAVSGDALVTALNTASGTSLSLDGATAKKTYANAVTKTSAMRALCVDASGKLYAVT